jgi:predicted nucleotidyltransferase
MINEMQKKIILDLLEPYKPAMIGLFGSYARGEEQPDSDLDLLVRFENRINLLDIIGLEQSLSEKLGIKVDLITDRSVHPGLMPHIQNDLQRIY